MTDTRISRPTARDSHVQSASGQALAWMARQLRWEQTLAALRAGRAAGSTPAPSRRAA